MGVNQLVGLARVQRVAQCPMLERAHVVERVVADLVSGVHDVVVKVVIAEHVFAHHEERSLHVIPRQRLKNERRRLGNGAVVERQVDRMVVLVHPPERVGINPS